MTFDLRLVAYAAGGARLGVLPEPLSVQVSFPHNDVGALSVTYSRLTLGGSLLDGALTDGMEIAVEVTDGGGEWVEPDGGRFLVLKRVWDQLDESDTVTLTCPAYGWLLSKARNLETANLLPADHSQAGKRAFYSASAGMVLRTLLDENAARDGVPVTCGFSSTLDTASAAWASVITIYYDLGIQMSSVLENLTSQGMCDWRTSGRTLQVWNPDTACAPDVSDTVRLQLGVDVDEAPSEETLEELASRMLIRGEDDLILTEENPATPTPWGEWESYVEQGGVSDTETALALAQADLADQSRVRGQYTRQLILADPRWLPMVDYGPGAWVTAPTTVHGERVRVQQVTLTRDKDGIVSGSVVLNDRLLDAELRRAKRMSGIVGGSSAGGTNVRPAAEGVDRRQPAAPLGLVVDTDAYIDELGAARGRLSAAWGAVTTATDGTAMEIAGYDLALRRNVTGAPWTVRASVDDLDADVSGLDVGEAMQAKVRARGRYSTTPGAWSDPVTFTVEADVTPPPVPSPPVLASQLGIISITWDGLTGDGGEMPRDFRRVAVYREGTTDPIDYLAAAGTVYYTRTTYGVSERFRFKAEDNSGNLSAFTAWRQQTPVPIVDTDLIETTLQDAHDEAAAAQADATQALADALAAHAAAMTAQSDAAAAQSAAESAQSAAEGAQSSADVAQSTASAAASDLLTLAGKSGRVIRQESAPTGSDASANNLWIKTSTGRLYAYVSGSWTLVTDDRLTAAAAAADAAQNAAAAAQSQADSATALASAAQLTADSAQSQADDAHAEALAGQSQAAAAAAAASSAQAAATTAQETADGLLLSARNLVSDPSISGGQWVETAYWKVDTAVGRTDSASLSASNVSGGQSMPIVRNAAGSIVTIPVEPGQVWEVSGWCKTTSDWNGTSGNSKIRLAKQDGSIVAQATATASVDTWTQRKTRYTVPATGVTGLRVELRADNTAGTIWWDDLSVRDVTEAVAAQSTADNAASAAAAAQATADQAAANALQALADYGELSGDVSTLSGMVTISTSNPTTADGSGKPVNAVWDVRSGSTIVRRFVWDGSAWTQVTVGQDFIGENAIGSAQIGSAAVGTAEIADLAVVNAKIGDLSVGKLTATGGATFPTAVVNTLMVQDTFTDGLFANKGVFGDFTNYAAGGDFENAARIPWGITGAAFSLTTSPVHTGTQALAIASAPSSRGTTNNLTIPAQEGDRFFVSLWAYATTGYDGTVGNAKLRAANGATDALIWSVGYQASVLTVGAWTQVTGTITVPAGVTSVSFQIRADHTAGTLYLDDIVIRRMVGTTLIEPGAVVADHITATAELWAKVLAVAGDATIGGNLLVNNAITSSKIAAGALDAFVITSPQIQSVSTAARGIKWTGNTITAYNADGDETLVINGSTGAITMKGDLTSGSTITGSTITGGVIRTATSGKRLILSPSTDGNPGIWWYDSSVQRLAIVIDSDDDPLMYFKDSSGTTRTRFTHEGTWWYDSTGEMALRIYGDRADGKSRAWMVGPTVNNTYGFVFLGSDTVDGVSSQAARLDIGGSGASSNKAWVYVANGGSWKIGGARGYADLDNSSGAMRLYTSTGLYWWYSLPSTTSTGNPLTMMVSSSGKPTIYYQSSLRADKVDIQDLTTDADVLALQPRTFLDRTAMERYEAGLEATAQRAEGLDPAVALTEYEGMPMPRRIPGLIAEEVAEVMPELASWDDAGTLTGVQYDRLAVYLIPVLRDLRDRISTLEEKVSA